MHIPRIYLDQSLHASDTIVLPENVSHHLRHVLRVKKGSEVILFNGQGGEYPGEISLLERSGLEIRLVRKDAVNRESPLNTRLGLGILKRDAMNSALQKATELGATELTPLQLDNTSVTKKHIEKRLEHWQQIIQSAAEQSGRTMLPVLNPPQNLPEWLNSNDAELKLLASPGAPSDLNSINLTPGSVSLLIGPEGGTTVTENALAISSGFTPTSFGGRILRAQTAPIALLALVQFRWGDL